MSKPRPTDVPSRRDEIVAILKQHGQTCCSDCSDHKSAPASSADAQDEAARGLAIHGLPVADLFYISEPMVDLASVAGTSLRADFELDATDVPSRTGLMCLERPIPFPVEEGVPYPIGAIFWDLYTADPGETPTRMLVMWFADTRDPTFPGFGSPGSLPRYFYCGSGSIPIGRPIRSVEDVKTGAVSDATESVSHLATIKAAWLLMTQAIGTDERIKVGRPAAKRGGRMAKRPEVRVISLRRPTSSGGEPGDGREWHHRWIVRGHWRMQPWGPKRERVRPVWIAPHVKGPEGKPMIGGEKVYAWTK